MRNPRVTGILDLITNGPSRRGTLPGRLCAACLAALPVSGVSVSLITASGVVILLAATDRRSRQLEELQVTLAEGPAVDASNASHPLLQPDLATAGPIRWPKFCKATLPMGVRAVFAFPLGDESARLGVLTMHRDTPGRLTRAELGEALAFAGAATAVLLHLRDRAGIDRERTTPAEPAEPAEPDGPDGPAVVHRAVGMITAQLGVSPDEALLRLRAHAYATGRTVAEVAADVLGNRLSFRGRADAHEW